VSFQGWRTEKLAHRGVYEKEREGKGGRKDAVLDKDELGRRLGGQVEQLGKL